MGIETDSDIDYGKIFGPFPDVGQISKSFFIGLLTTDEHEENSNIKVNINTAALSVTWLPYIRAARNEDEQNMEAYTKNGHIYYRTLRIIKSGEELLVWYSKDFCQILGVPDVKSRGGTESHVCETCGAKFRYPYPLMAHIKFRCARVGYGITSTLPEVNTAHNSPVSRLTKRFVDTDECPVPVKRLFEHKMSEINNNNNSANSVEDPSGIVKHDSAENGLSDTWSAFKKVEKAKTGDVRFKDEHTPTSISQFSVPNDAVRLRYEQELNNYLCNKFSPLDMREKGITESLGMFMPSSWMMPNLFPHQRNLTQESRHDKTYRIPTEKNAVNNVGREFSKSVADAGALQMSNNDILNKQMILDELQSFQMSHFKPANPMVDKIIHTATSPALLQRPMRTFGMSQNWCAKCNASFRMTSDLVYHMRSHHKREFDPMKRKREEKLQCNVCRETFKERHHLTRHMTSHT